MLTYFDPLARFGLNLAAMATLLFCLYYPRYRNKETAIAAALFNVFAFAVLSVLASVQFGITAGFGLFAILALFTLRSEQISKSDIAYVFGSVSIAVLASVPGTALDFVVLMLVVVVAAVYVIDHPRILHSANQMRLTLDTIPPDVLSDPESLIAALSDKLGVRVVSVRVISVDYVTEVVQVEVNFRVVE